MDSTLTKDDHIILNKLQSGDIKGLNTLFDKYFPMLMRKAYSLTGDREVSEELTQDIFVYLWKSRETLDIQSNLKSYLFQSIRNRCYTHHRKELKKKGLQVQDESAFMHVQAPTTADMETADLQLLIESAISKLPEKTRTVFLMSREEELGYKEIASHLDISIKTVEYHMGNALKMIKTYLGPYGYLFIIWLSKQ